jgi:hypothetical protein
MSTPKKDILHIFFTWVLHLVLGLSSDQMFFDDTLKLIIVLFMHNMLCNIIVN